MTPAANVRSKALVGTIVVLVVAVAMGAVLARRGSDAGVESTSATPAAHGATAAATTPPSAAPAPATPATAAPVTATSPAPAAPAPPPTQTVSGYSFVPKPATGPGSIAPGGALTKHLADDIAAAFGFGIGPIEAAIDGLVLPPEAGGNPEGWLAPGAYPAVETPVELVQAMLDRRIEQLEVRSVPREDWHRVLTAASVIETETYNQNEKPFVARVLTNRLAEGGPLQMDSIILYPVPEDRIFTTADERGSDQPYNSYRYDGLPPTPISAPDEASIDAFLNPPPGDWFFYVTVDLDSGETRYAVTYDDHLDNVELLRGWLDAHPTR